jgi:hypothetical protein
MICTRLRVTVCRDVNEFGRPAWFATPYYRRGGRVVSIPADCQGWPTKAKADREAAAIRRAARRAEGRA